MNTIKKYKIKLLLIIPKQVDVTHTNTKNKLNFFIKRQ